MGFIIKQIILTFTILLMLIFSANAQKMQWLNNLRTLSLLQSTEHDVERLFGKAKERYANIGEYEIDAGRLAVTYFYREMPRN